MSEKYTKKIHLKYPKIHFNKQNSYSLSSKYITGSAIIKNGSESTIRVENQTIESILVNSTRVQFLDLSHIPNLNVKNQLELKISAKFKRLFQVRIAF